MPLQLLAPTHPTPSGLALFTVLLSAPCLAGGDAALGLTFGLRGGPALPLWKEGLIPKPPAWPVGLVREKGSTASPLSHSTRPHNSRAVPMLPWHGTWGCQKYLFLVQAVKQGFLLHPKANVDQGTVLPRAESSQAGWEAAETLAGETKRNNSEASFSSPTQHNREQRRAQRDGSPQAAAVPALGNSCDGGCFLLLALSSQPCSLQRSKEQPHTAMETCSRLFSATEAGRSGVSRLNFHQGIIPAWAWRWDWVMDWFQRKQIGPRR